MKDKIFLILTGLICAALAHIYYNSLGDNAFIIDGIILIIIITPTIYKKLRNKH